MWTVHRLESRGKDLVVFARDLEGGRVPPGAVVADAVLNAGVGASPRLQDFGDSRHRDLTEGELVREAAQGRRRQGTLAAVAGGVLGESEDTSYAAFDFPGCGWDADSSVEIHLPLE